MERCALELWHCRFTLPEIVHIFDSAEQEREAGTSAALRDREQQQRWRVLPPERHDAGGGILAPEPLGFEVTWERGGGCKMWTLNRVSLLGVACALVLLQLCRANEYDHRVCPISLHMRAP